MKKIKAALLCLAAVLPLLLFSSGAWAQTEREMLEEWKEILSKGNIDAAFPDKIDRAKARFLMGLMRLAAGELEEARRDFYESIMNRPDFLPEETGFSPDILQIYGKIRARLIGSMYVSSEPVNGSVYVDEELMGRTPVVLENILGGMRVVRIAGEGYVGEERIVYIYPNKRQYLHIELRHDDTVAPKIFHDAPESGYEGRALRMRAIIKDIYGIKTARIYFRIGVEGDFSVIPLQKTGKDAYEAAVPAEKAVVGTLQYYIEAIDTNGNGASLMSAEEQFNINIVPLDPEPPVRRAETLRADMRAATPGSPQKIEAVNVIPYSEGVILSRSEENGVQGKKVIINVGAKRGVKPEDIFTVIRYTQVVKDFETGEILEANRQEIAGRVRLTGVGPEISKGEIIKESEKGAIEAGLFVRSRPGKVYGVSAKSDQAKRIDISWQAGAEPEIAGYNIYRAERADGEFVKIEITNGRTKTEVVDKGSYQQRLIDGKTYFYRVSAFNRDKVEGGPGDIIEASTQQDIGLYSSFKA
ncbi:MAG: PEGA domain-containing protein, partial [Nitrospinota bacterium]